MPANAGRIMDDGDRIRAADIEAAVTAGMITYADGATQSFTADGRTIYTENGRPAEGAWGLDDDGRFWSFWPPSYRATYDLLWVVEADRVIGVRFVDLDHGSVFEGRYA